MTSNARDAEVDVIARDKTSKPVRGITREYERLKRQVDRTIKSNNSATNTMHKSISRVTKTVAVFARTVGKAASAVAGMTSLVGPLVVGLLAAGKAVAAFGRGLAGLGPLAAFIPSLAGAMALLVGTVKLIGPGLGRALEPIRRQFVDAEGNATRFTRRLQDLAAKGIEPLARNFVKVNFPAIAAAMERLARSTNRVTVSAGKWVNSVEGQRLIRIITSQTAAAMERLEPKINAAVVALGRLALRAGDKAIKGLADLVGRILDKFTEWANNTSIEDIKNAISDLSGWFTVLRDKFNGVREIGRWMSENEGKVRKFSSAIAGLGLAIGLLSGSWVGVILGAFSLLVLHWDTVKAKLSGAGKWWSNLWTSLKNDPAIRNLVHEVQVHIAMVWAAVRPLWEKFKQEMLPQLKELREIIMRDLIPAVTNFIKAVGPIVVWFITVFGPVVIDVFKGVLTYITNALRVLAGIFNTIAGLITGDWSLFWKGIKQITVGGMDATIAVFRMLWNVVRTVSAGGVAAVFAVFLTLVERIRGLFAGARDWLFGAGRAIVQGLVDGLRSGAGLLPGAVRGLIDKAKSLIPGPLRGAIPFSLSTDGWRPAQFAAQFAGGGLALAGAPGGGGGRTGGPTPVSVDVSLAGDLAQFFQLTARTVTAAQDRERWRNRVGKR